jgi:hypothetical protein
MHLRDEEDDWPATAGLGLQRLDCQDWVAKTGLPRLACRDLIARSGLQTGTVWTTRVACGWIWPARLKFS